MRVVIIGAGIIGASIAYHLARRNADVTVIERDQPASVATAKSFAWINASYDNPKPYYKLRFQSMLEYPRLQRELDGALKINWGGSLLWEDETEHITQFVNEHRRWGYSVRLIDRKEFQALEPHVVDPPAQAAYAELEGSVDPVHATKVLLSAAENIGVRTFCESPVTGFDVKSNHIRGVLTRQGHFEADYVVLAAGVDTPTLASELGVDIPLVDSPGLLIHTKPVRPIINRLVLSPGVHMKQQSDGRIVAGEDFGGGDVDIDPNELARRILKRITERLLGLENIELDRISVGWRPLPKDHMPIIGFASSVKNLYVSVMHSGVTLAPIVGRLAANEILDGETVDLLEPYRPE
ncbi:MAG: FAD-binding oxidoreductase, partial [Gammaproteobacteria bacterium]|nr:FAD-binding oxidoreductase [Gammaproteobacteria bacterium]